MLKRIIITVLILMAMAGTAMAKQTISSNKYKAHGPKYSSWMTVTVICEGGYKYLVVVQGDGVTVTQMLRHDGSSLKPIPCK